jgi:hypothetical protein
VLGATKISSYIVTDPREELSLLSSLLFLKTFPIAYCWEGLDLVLIGDFTVRGLLAPFGTLGIMGFIHAAEHILFIWFGFLSPRASSFFG